MRRLKVAIIGNGIAGFSAASALRSLDRESEITMFSRETTPLYSPCALPDYIAGEIPRHRLFVKSERDYEALGIRTRFEKEVRKIDGPNRELIMDGGERFPFDRLIIATGSEAILLGEMKRGVFKLKTLRDAEAILDHQGKKAVVVGTGAIGIEIGIALRQRGYEVVLLEMLDHILPLGLDRKAADKVKTILTAQGIEVFCGERAEKVLGEERVDGLITDKQQIACDTLILAVGMKPNVALVKEAGVSVGAKGGIKVNSRMETNIPGVYACGDCVESRDALTGESYLHLFWHNAARQGTVAGRNCAGVPTEYRGSQNLLNVEVFGHHVVGFGFTEAALHRFKDIDAFGGDLSDLSVVEEENGNCYFRLVVKGDRVMGGQFIDVGQRERDVGLLWSFITQRRSVGGLIRILENEALLKQKPWARRLDPFFATEKGRLSMNREKR